MFPDGRDHSIVQRGIDEALACRDMLAPAPCRLSPYARVIAYVGDMSRAVRSVLVRFRSHRRPTSGSITKTMR